MKSLSIKKYLIGFMVATMSIFVLGIGSVKAYTLNFDYENIEISENHQSKINDIRSTFLSGYEDYPYKLNHVEYEHKSYVMFYSPSGYFYIYVINDKNKFDYTTRNYYYHYNQRTSEDRNFYYFSDINSSNNKIIDERFCFYYYSIDINNYEIGSFSLDNYTSGTENVTFSSGVLKKTRFSGTNQSILNLSSYINKYNAVDGYNSLLYDTNFTMSYLKMGETELFNESHTFKADEIMINGEVLNSGDSFPTYLDYKIPPAEIELSKAYANDLDGTDKYIITANFEEIFDTGLIYQIKIGDNDWQDISHLIYDLEYTEQYGYMYTYDAYYNQEFKARVLYEDGTIKDEKSINVTELSEFGMNISHAAASDTHTRYINVLTVDLRNCWDLNWTYQYSYDNQKFYNISKESKVFYLNHALNIPIFFRILNTENNVIYSQEYDVDFEDLNKNVLFYESTNIVNQEKQIIIKADFTEYLQFFDMYNFRIIVNGVEYDEQTFLLEFISTKDNYIKAISYEIYVDNLKFVDLSYRVGSQGTGGGSDSNFDDMYDKILEDQLNKELENQDFSTTEGMINSIKNFLNAIKEFITLFFKLIMRFFNGLNIWIRTSLIGEFVIMVICRIIKAVRK